MFLRFWYYEWLMDRQNTQTSISPASLHTMTMYRRIKVDSSWSLVWLDFFRISFFLFFVFFQFLCFVGLVLNQRLQFFFCFVPPYIQPYKIKQIHIHLLNKTELSLCVCCCRSSIANMPAATPVACDLPTIKHLNVAYTLY